MIYSKNERDATDYSWLIVFSYFSFPLVDWVRNKFRASSPPMFNYSQVTSDTAKLVTLGPDQEL